MGTEVMAVVETQDEMSGRYFRVEVRVGEKWRRIRTAYEESVGAGCAGSYRWTFSAGSRYAEYNWFQRDHRAYIFEKPGKYELRAAVQLKDRELVSEAVSVTVSERSERDLQRVELVPASFNSLRWPLHDQWIALQSLGGNIKASVHDFALAHEYVRTGKVKGEEVSKKGACDVLARHMDPISWEYHLALLGDYYVAMQDIEGLAYVVRAAPPFDSRGFKESESHLRSFRWRKQLEEEAAKSAERDN